MHHSKKLLAIAVAALATLTVALVTGQLEERSDDALYATVEHVIPRASFDRMKPVHKRMLAHLADAALEGRERPACCWADGETYDFATMSAFNAAIQGGTDFQLGGRWTSTAMSGGGLGQGDPTIITYSFVPDGTTVPSGTGEPSGTSSLFSWMNGIYGSATTWQNLFHQVFQDWGSRTGVTYVHEPNDDGVPLFGSSGISGVRGDVRISAKPIDGNSGVLAYNFFPSGGGDMVLDANDGFYNTTSNNSRRLRNVVAHEHGHGMGMFHVCPANETKLMEPFFSAAYDGPQHDDDLGAQRHYGDYNEHNDTSSTATPFGAIANGTHTMNEVSLDDNGDVDWYSFSVTGNKQITATVTPVGSSYTQGPQTAQCNGGTTYDSASANNLAIEVRDTNGATVLASVDAGGPGSTEILPPTPLPSGSGLYYIRVFGATANTVQMYDLSFTIADFTPPAFDITFPNGVPTNVTPSQATSVLVHVDDVSGTHDPATGQLHLSIDGGQFTAQPLNPVGGGDYDAILPAVPCNSTIDWYVSFAETGGGPVVTAPFGAPTASHRTDATGTVLFDDDFQTAMGWTVTNSASLTDGAWQRAVPAGGGDRGDPANDFDGSGLCYVTDAADGNSDVDGGTTTLTSPVFDLSGESSVIISFAFWHDNDFGNNPGEDPFVMQITDDGTNWITFESYNQNTDTWNTREIDPSQFVSLTSTVRLRFISQDLGAGGSVVESGLDAFRIVACGPFVPPGPALLPLATGNVGFGQGGPFSTLLINGSAGLPDRRVDVGVGQPFTLEMATPPVSTGSEPFAIWGFIGVPGISDITALTGVGIFVFEPCTLNPGGGTSFTLTNNFGPDACGQLVASTPTPWTLNYPGLGFPFTVTFQGAMTVNGSLAVTNGIILRIQ